MKRWLTSCCLLLGPLSAGVSAADALVILSPHWEGVRYEFGEAFRQHYRTSTGREVDLKWLDVGGTSEILRFLRSEFKKKPGGIGVDLLFGGGTDPFEELKNQGLLAPHRVPDDILRNLAPQINGVPLYDKNHAWYAATMAGFGIIYNKVVLKRLGLPEPTTWEDLAKPEVLSWVGSADPRKSGSVHVMYEIILQGYGWKRGWEIITALGGNVRSFTAAGSQTPKDVALGEVAYGLAIDSYAWAQIREVGQEVIGYVMPKDRSVFTGDAIAILAGAPNRQVAERFITFVLSEDGQKLWLLQKGQPDGPKRFELRKLSVLPGLYSKTRGRAAVEINPFELRSQLVYDPQKGSGRWEIVNDLIGTQIIEPHDRLVRAWRNAIGLGRASAALADLAAIGLDEAQAEQLVRSGRWKEAEYRNRTMQQWAASARKRYGAEPAAVRVIRNTPAVIALGIGITMVVYLRRHKARSGPPK